MKQWTIQFDLLEGNDEFWERNPPPDEVLSAVWTALADGHLYFNKLRCIKVVEVDDNEYFPKEQER
jgi:hypothetical protein